MVTGSFTIQIRESGLHYISNLMWKTADLISRSVHIIRKFNSRYYLLLEISVKIRRKTNTKI